MINELILQKFKNKYPDYKIPGGILFEDDDIALYLYSKGVILNIGTYLGQSTVILSLKAKKVYTIDAFFEHGSLYDNFELYRYENVKKELSKYENIELIKGKSQDVKLDEKFDMIFIDGGHEYIQVKQDYEQWSKKLKKGGHVLFHDCINEYPGILQLCQDIKDSNEMKFIEKIGVINIFKNENNSVI